MLTAAGALRPGFSTADECLAVLAAAASTEEARAASLAFVRAPDLFQNAHRLRPARRAWEEAFASAWADEAGLLEQGPWQGDMSQRPPGHTVPTDVALAEPPLGRAPYARTLEEVAERGRVSGRRPATGRRAR